MACSSRLVMGYASLIRPRAKTLYLLLPSQDLADALIRLGRYRTGQQRKRTRPSLLTLC
jgi:hypothetical protein